MSTWFFPKTGGMVTDKKTIGMDLFAAVLVVVALWSYGCVEGTGSKGGDTDTDVDTDIDTDTDADTDVDECRYDIDCPGQVCDEGKCAPAPGCSSRTPCKPWYFCTNEPTGKAADRRCVKTCLTDLDCPADGQCYYGLCWPYELEWSDKTPLTGRSPSDRSGLTAGVAEAVDDVPVGISMAGFGARPGEQTPFNSALGGSKGWFDYPKVQALVLDDGYERVVLMQVPMGWSSDMMRTLLAQELQARLGVNYIDHIITMSNHSHSWPGRFWNVVPEAGLGAFGHGDYDGVISERRVKRWADVVEEALSNMVPARFGYAVDTNFDPDGKVHHRRRDEYTSLPDGTPAGVDKHLLMVRIDYDQGDKAGKPMAVILGFSDHGTLLTGEYISGDSPYGVVKATRQAIEEEAGVPVVVFHDNTCGGDTSPTAGMFDVSEDYPGSAYYAGYNSLDYTLPLFKSLDGKTVHGVKIQVGWRRVPVSYFDLGYEYNFEDDTGQFYDKESLLNGGNQLVYRLGAFQCALSVPSDKDPTTRAEDGNLGCLLSVELINKYRSIPQFGKATLSILRIGTGAVTDDLFLATIPGEPHTPLMWLYQDEAHEKFGIPEDNVYFIGYSQDHHFYLMTSPDWFQGGYEPSMDIWGWREGDYYYEKSMELLGKVVQGDDRAREEVDKSKPWLKPLIAPEQYAKHVLVPPTATSPADAGRILKQPPQTVERLDLIEFSWEGGFTNADWPMVDLQVKKDGQWIDVVNAAGRPYNDDGDKVVVEYDWSRWKAFSWEQWENGEIEQGDRKNVWSARFEELMDFPTGTYRFRIKGSYCPDTSKCDPWGTGLEAYETYTEQFELKECSKLMVWDVKLDNGRIQGRVAYPPGHMATDDGGLSKNLSMRSYRFRGMKIHPYGPGPLSTEKGDVTVTVTGGGLSGPLVADQLQPAGNYAYHFVEWRRDDYSEGQCNDKGGTWNDPYCEKTGTLNVQTTGFSLPSSGLKKGDVIRVEVSDQWGNTGVADVTL